MQKLCDAINFADIYADHTHLETMIYTFYIRTINMSPNSELSLDCISFIHTIGIDPKQKFRVIIQKMLAIFKHYCIEDKTLKTPDILKRFMETEYAELRDTYDTHSFQNPQLLCLVMSLAYLLRCAKKVSGNKGRLEKESHIEWARILFIEKDKVNSKT